MLGVSKCQRARSVFLSCRMLCMVVAIVDRWRLKGGGCARSMNQVVMCSGISSDGINVLVCYVSALE